MSLHNNNKKVSVLYFSSFEKYVIIKMISVTISRGRLRKFDIA